MKASKNPKKHGIKKIWIISYLIVFLVPLFVGMIAGTMIFNGYKSQVQNRNNIVLDTVCATVDAQLEAIVTSSVQLNSNKYVKEIGKFEKPLTPEMEYRVYEFVKDFNTLPGYESVVKYSDAFFLYFSGIDYVARSTSIQPTENFYNAYINEKEYTEEEWKNFVKAKYNGDFVNARLLTDENELLFIRTLKNSYFGDKYVNAIYKINTEEIVNNVKNLYFYEYGSFSITDADGKVILTINDDVNNEKKSGKMGKILSFEKISEAAGWTYTYTLPASKAYGNVYKILITMIFLYVLCLAAGIWMIKYFTGLNYKPINTLMTLFPDDERKDKSDEFSYLNQKITESLSHNIALNKEIDSQSKMIREHLISEMIMGHSPVGKRSRTELDKLQFDIENSLFAVFIYSLGDEDTDDLSMKQFVLCNVTDELLTNENIKFASTKKEDDIVYIVSAEDEAVCQSVLEMAQFLLSFTQKEFSFKFFSAMGNLMPGAKGIGKSYNEAKRALEYAIASSNSEFIRYNDVAESLKDGYFFSVETESQLVTLIKANEQKKVDLLLCKIFAEAEKAGASLDSVRYLMVELFATVKRLMMQYGHSIQKEYPEENLFVENIFDSRDIEKMRNVIRYVCTACCKDVFELPSNKDDLISGIMRYVNQNYSNQNLTLRHIGDAFSMNPDYVSRRFREHTGKTINDYIRDIRIEKAKQLLRESGELIADIAEMVGFTSYRTFVRVFTEVVGVTPNKYKTMK